MLVVDLFEVHYTDIYPKSFEAFRQKYRKLARKGLINNLYVNFSDHIDNPLDKRAYTSPDHHDPIGVYAYPIKYVLSHPADIWYGKKARYMRVIESRARNVLHMGSIDERRARDLLYKMGMRDPDWLLRVADKDLKQRIKGRNRAARAFLAAVQLDLTVAPAREDRGIFGKSVNFPVRSGAAQTALFKKAGFDAIEDTATSNASAVINEREPEQICFLSRGAFRVVEVVALRPQLPKDRAGITFTAPGDDKRIPRRVAAMIATAMGDKLREMDEWGRKFWTKQGRRIEIKYERPQSYYRDRKMGEKKHREDREGDPHWTKVDINTEFGPIYRSYVGDETVVDIVDDIGRQWKRLQAEQQPDPNWRPETQGDYNAAVERQRQEWSRQENEKKNRKLLDEYPVLASQITWMANHLGVPVDLPTTPDDQIEFVRQFEWLRNHRHRMQGEPTALAAYDAMVEGQQELKNAGIHDLSSRYFEGLRPLIVATQQALQGKPGTWQWNYAGPWMFNSAREVLEGKY